MRTSSPCILCMMSKVGYTTSSISSALRALTLFSVDKVVKSGIAALISLALMTFLRVLISSYLGMSDSRLIAKAYLPSGFCASYVLTAA